MESENSGQSRKEKLKLVYNLGNRKQMTLFGTRQATQDLEMEDAQNDEVKKEEEENIRRTTRRSNSNPPTLSEDYEEEKLLNLFNNMNLEEEEKKVTQEQINAKKRTERNKKYERLKMLHFMGLSNTEIANDLQVNLSLSTVKRLRDQIRYNGDIDRVIGSGMKRKLNSEQERFVVDWALENPLLSTVKLCERIHRKFEIEISHDTILRILTRYGFTWKSPIITFKNTEIDKQNRLAFWNRNKYLSFNNVFFSDESTFYTHYPGKARWVNPGEVYTQTKTKYTKKVNVWGAFWSMGTVKLQFFEGNMDSKKYIEILNNSKREMNELIPDKWILQWDNDSKHFSNITLDYYIENDIKVLEWSAYSLIWTQ